MTPAVISKTRHLFFWNNSPEQDQEPCDPPVPPTAGEQRTQHRCAAEKLQHCQTNVTNLNNWDGFLGDSFVLSSWKASAQDSWKEPCCLWYVEKALKQKVHFLLTLLACSSCSESSSRAVACLCLISWIWASWFLVSSSIAFFSSATSCSRFVLEEAQRITKKSTLQFFINHR